LKYKKTTKGKGVEGASEMYRTPTPGTIEPGSEAEITPRKERVVSQSFAGSGDEETKTRALREPGSFTTAGGDVGELHKDNSLYLNLGNRNDEDRETEGNVTGNEADKDKESEIDICIVYLD